MAPQRQHELNKTNLSSHAYSRNKEPSISYLLKNTTHCTSAFMCSYSYLLLGLQAGKIHFRREKKYMC